MIIVFTFQFDYEILYDRLLLIFYFVILINGKHGEYIDVTYIDIPSNKIK
jgi:hypothetical protein